MKKEITKNNKILTKNKLKNGISLITLVITIVVIIILAAAVILSLNNNNLITNANIATVKNDISEAQSAYSIYVGDLIIEELDNVQGKGTIGKTTSNFVTTTSAGVEETRNITLADIGVDSTNVEEISIVGNTIVGIKWKNKYYNKDGEVVTEEEYANLMPENLGEGTRDKTKASYNVPYVPEGFTYKEGTVDAGYVIQDGIGNEFVWIPVDGINVTYGKWVDSDLDPSDEEPDTLPAGVTSEQDQIDKYEGFYIARYEAGVPEGQTEIDGEYGDGDTSKSDKEGIPVSKKGAIVWTNIGYEKAKLNAESMISTDYVKSGLITGTMWDTVMLYLQKAGYDINDSRSWGNHWDSIENAAVVENGEQKYGSKQTAGYSEYWSAKGIYNIAGNVSEWTNEKYVSDSTSRILRGGSYDDYGRHYPASSRSDFVVSFTFDSVGFRSVLYIM